MSNDESDFDPIIARYLGRWVKFSDRSRLYHDLFISGDDASEMLEELRDAFRVDFEGFAFDRYFPNEHEGAILPVLAKMFGYKGKRWKPCTVGHLRAVVAARKWFSPTE